MSSCLSTGSKKSFYSIPGFDFNQSSGEIDLLLHTARRFHELPCLGKAHQLNLDKTGIKSFKFTTKYADITEFNCKLTSLARERYLILMSVIVFGPQLQKVNDKFVKEKDRKLASRLGDILYEELVSGWILRTIKPIVLYNPQTSKRKVLETVKCSNVSDLESLKFYEDIHSQGDIPIYIDGSEDVELDVSKLRSDFNRLVHPQRPEKVEPMERVFERPSSMIHYSSQISSLGGRSLFTTPYHVRRPTIFSDSSDSIAKKSSIY